jgi:DNA-binding NtrC family response regulator
MLLDLSLPDGSGLSLLDAFRDDVMAPVVLVLTGDLALETAVTAVRRGAYDYLVKPFSLSVISQHIHQALEYRKANQEKTVAIRLGKPMGNSTKAIKPVSKVMIQLLEKANKIARHDKIPVLITGETGVGKEFICRYIHEISPRAGEPFVAINCAELDRGLLRSELFGHERGSFTGASERHAGLFEQASQGTLLLDEIGEMPPDIQAAFLRVLENGTFRRIGGSVEQRTNARIIAATNRDLHQLAEEDKFRLDFLYRLNTVELVIPPLRERPEDIRHLAHHYVGRLADEFGVRAHITEEAMGALLTYPWPGNIRELRSVLERSLLLKGGGALTRSDLNWSSAQQDVVRVVAPKVVDPQHFPSLAEVEAEHIHHAMVHTKNNTSRAARLLGISRSTLIRKLHALREADEDSAQVKEG